MLLPLLTEYFPCFVQSITNRVGKCPIFKFSFNLASTSQLTIGNPRNWHKLRTEFGGSTSNLIWKFHLIDFQHFLDKIRLINNLSTTVKFHLWQGTISNVTYEEWHDVCQGCHELTSPPLQKYHWITYWIHLQLSGISNLNGFVISRSLNLEFSQTFDDSFGLQELYSIIQYSIEYFQYKLGIFIRKSLRNSLLIC